MHLHVKVLRAGVSRDAYAARGGRTFFSWGSEIVETRWLSSLRMAFAATPVVAVLKSIWLVPRVRVLNDSARLGIRLAMAALNGVRAAR